MEITIKLTFDKNWQKDAGDCNPEIIVEDAIRELAEGVGYEILEYKLNT